MRDEGRPLRLEEGRKEVEKFRLRDSGIEKLRNFGSTRGKGRRKETENIECRIMNIECRRKEFYRFFKKIDRKGNKE